MTNNNYNITSVPSDTYKTFMEQYKIDHEVCPKCKGTNYSSTLMAFIFNSDDPSSYKDENNVNCNCGWVGIVHHLIKK